MNVYIVTWVDEYDEIRAEQVEAHNCADACYEIGCDVEDVISVMRIYSGDSR